MFLSTRQALSADERTQQRQDLQARLGVLEVVVEARTIALYRPIRGELSLQSLVQAWRAQGKTLLFPRCEGKRLRFAPARSTSEWRRSAFGVLEPTTPAVDPLTIDLLIIPAIACDHLGVRLGYGGGYYDRFLNNVPDLVERALAVTNTHSLIERLPRDPWDVPLKCVITPDRRYVVEGRRPHKSNITGHRHDGAPLKKGDPDRA